MEDYGRLESVGWKAASGTAISPDMPRAILPLHARSVLPCGKRPHFTATALAMRVVAVDLCIEGGGALVILKTTYDESMQVDSPAFLMRQEAFRKLFDEGQIKRIEFYGRVMEWHTKWSNDVRTMYHVNLLSVAVPSEDQTHGDENAPHGRQSG